MAVGGHHNSYRHHNALALNAPRPAPAAAPSAMAPVMAPAAAPPKSKIPVRRLSGSSSSNSLAAMSSRHGSHSNLAALPQQQQQQQQHQQHARASQQAAFPPPPAAAPAMERPAAAQPPPPPSYTSEEALAESAVSVADMLSADLIDPACCTKAEEALRAHESGLFEQRFDGRHVRRFLHALYAAARERGVAPDALWRALDALERN